VGDFQVATDGGIWVAAGDKIKRVLTKSAQEASSDMMKAILIKVFSIGVSVVTPGAA
jgi:hypothetical protein